MVSILYRKMAAQAAVVQLCDVCDSENNVKWYCKDCHEVMCESCRSVHLRSRKTKNDDLIPLSQARDIKKIPAIWCDFHSSEEVRGRCQPCDQLVCMICLHEKHNGHKWILLDDFRRVAAKEFENVKEKFSSRLLLGQGNLEMERDTFEKKSANFDEIEADITNHSEEIILEVTILRDEMLQSVAKARQKELDRYTETTASLKSENAEVESEVVKLDGLHDTECVDPSVVMKSANAATQSLTRLKTRHTPSPTSLAKFQSGNIDRHTLQLMLGTCLLDVSPIAVDKPKLKVVSSITVPGKRGYVKTIVPDKRGNFWISTSDDNKLTLIQKDGTVIKTSSKFWGNIIDAVALNDNILVTNEGEKTIVNKISPDGFVSTFSNHSPYCTNGLCATTELDVLVCLYLEENYRIERLGQDAVVKQIIHIADNKPNRITCLRSGEIFIACRFGIKGIICMNRNGSHLFELDKNLIESACITNDSKGNVFATDDFHNKVFLLGLDGSVICVLDQSVGIKNPWAIVVPTDGQMMIGCDSRTIMYLEY